MPPSSFPIIDADGHVMEPAGMWQRWIDPAFRDRAPRIVQGPDGRGRLATDGHLSPRADSISAAMLTVFAENTRRHVASALEAGYSAESQVRALDEGGVEVSFLYPTQGLYVASVEGLDPVFALAICRAYNDWLLDFCAYAPERLRPVGMLVALHDPAAAVAEATRLADRGVRAIFVRPNPLRGRTLGDPAYDPLWAECERRGLTVGIHEGVGAHLPTVGGDRFRTFFATHVASHPMEQMLAMLALIERGVLERYPRLRVAFLESGCGWLPYWLWRMDEHWEKTRGIAGEPELSLSPSDYVRRQCWISCEPDEPYLKDVIHLIGEDRVVFDSDYPHPDHVWPATVETMRAADLPDGVKRKILRDNAAALYAI
ncbi:MAG: amidohydrolase family protein [Gammaproteobacteria bacterium]